MPCYVLRDADGGAIGLVCGKFGPPCADCGGIAGFLCDYPLANGRACNRVMCARCGTEVATDTHYCRAHKDARA